MSGSRPVESRGTIGIVGAALLFGVATIAVVQFLRPSDAMPTSPFQRLASAVTADAGAAASPALDAFGVSGNVKMRFAMP